MTSLEQILDAVSDRSTDLSISNTNARNLIREAYLAAEEDTLRRVFAALPKEEIEADPDERIEGMNIGYNDCRKKVLAALEELSERKV